MIPMRTATTWQPWGLTLLSSVAYPAPLPWWGVELNGTFSHASGQRLVAPGFWDGGAVWRLRFSPPLAGVWWYKTSCSDVSNSGLHGAHGNFTAAAYTGQNPLYAHGVLRPAPGGRYLQHADATPFYWLGDTHWSGFSSAEHIDDTNNRTIDSAAPQNTSMFERIVDVRAAQGYSVWKAETFVINGPQADAHEGAEAIDGSRRLHAAVSNDGGPAWRPGGQYVDLNPEFWQAIDRRVALVNSRGMVVSMAWAGIGRGMTNVSLEAAIGALARYAVARYAAYSTVWTTCQEYCTQSDEVSLAWKRLAQLSWELDPLKRATSLHNCASNPIPVWRGESWYGHVTLQQGHRRVDGTGHWRVQYDATPARPLIEDEANYEHLLYGSMTPDQAVPSWMTRQSAWTSQMGGAIGFTYGGQGLWWACWNDSYIDGNCGPNGSPGYFTWWQTLDPGLFPTGNIEVPLMATTFRALPWFDLAPDDEAVAWDAEAGRLPAAQRPAQKACGRTSTASRHAAGLLGTTIIAYLPLTDAPGVCRPESNATVYGGVAGGLYSGSAHTSWWLNPRTGQRTLIATHPAGMTTATIPSTRPIAAETAQDWVWLLQPIGYAPAVTSAVAAVEGVVAPAGQSWVSSVAAGGRVRDEAGTNGCNFTLSASVHVSAICRYRVPGNRNRVQLLLTDALHSGPGAIIANATIDNERAESADPLGFVCGTVSATLAAGRSYVIAAANDGCDKWHDDEKDAIGTTSLTLSVNGVYQSSDPHSARAHWVEGGGGERRCYGPMNFYYNYI